MRLFSTTTSTPDADQKSARVLRQLYLTLFLRGHSARDLNLQKAPKSTGRKLAGTLMLYALVGGGAIFLLRQPIFYLSLYLHATTFTIVALFVGVSAGSQLFNPQEADILLHRPIRPQILLRAKVRTLVSVSLWLAMALNSLTMVAMIFLKDKGLGFFLIHSLTLFMEAILCTGTVVLAYQVCLRWMGRERIDNWMAFAQTMMTLVMVGASQLMPQFIARAQASVHAEPKISWWLVFVPPAWFAGLDDLVIRGPNLLSSVLASLAVVGTASIAWIAFEHLARTHHANLQMLSEIPNQQVTSNGERWLSRWLQAKWVKRLLPDRIARASFQLTIVYLLRDRETKMQVFPSLSPSIILPVLWLFSPPSADGFDVPIAMCGAFVATIPAMVLSTLQYSRSWQAAEIFRIAPLNGPSRIMAGARQAVLWTFVVPLMLIMLLLVIIKRWQLSDGALLIPGFLMVPIYLHIPFLSGRCVPFSMPPEESKSTRQGLVLTSMYLLSLPVSLSAAFARYSGYYGEFLLAEALVCVIALSWMRRYLGQLRWK